MKTVNYCPFCGDEFVVEVSCEKHYNSDSVEPVMSITTFHCEECHGEFTVTDNISGSVLPETSKTCTTCTDDDNKEECKCAAPAAEWYERRYYETLRELEKTRYLLDLTIKEGMRRE